MATVELTLTGVARRLRVQGWTLFWFLAACFVAAELRLASVIDWSNSADIRWLMGINWRLAAPYFLLTFAASPLHQLFPGGATRWLLANRRYIGLAFAVGAFCQLLPIVTLALRFQPALADIHSASSQFGEDCIYLTLVLMTVTSFRATNRHISRTTWRRLHSTGIYLCFLRAVRNRRDVCRAWHRVRCRLGDARPCGGGGVRNSAARSSSGHWRDLRTASCSRRGHGSASRATRHCGSCLRSRRCSPAPCSWSRSRPAVLSDSGPIALRRNLSPSVIIFLPPTGSRWAGTWRSHLQGG